MSILIKGMDVPSNCDLCIFDNGVNCMVYPPSEDMIYDIADGRPDWCPLIELPNHGRLIDADALMEICILGNKDKLNRNEYTSVSTAYKLFAKDIDDAPTIIEAEVKDDD